MRVDIQRIKKEGTEMALPERLAMVKKEVMATIQKLEEQVQELEAFSKLLNSTIGAMRTGKVQKDKK